MSSSSLKAAAIMAGMAATNVLAAADPKVYVPAFADKFSYSATVINADATSTTLAYVCPEQASITTEFACQPTVAQTITFGPSGNQFTRDGLVTTGTTGDVVTFDFTQTCTLSGTTAAACTNTLVVASGEATVTSFSNYNVATPLATATFAVIANASKLLPSGSAGSATGTQSGSATAPASKTSAASSSGGKTTTTTAAAATTAAASASGKKDNAAPGKFVLGVHNEALVMAALLGVASVSALAAYVL